MWIGISMIAVWALFSLTQVFAHGAAAHIMGTVTAVHEQRLEVKTKEGKTVGVQLTAKTNYRRSGKEAGTATSADVQVGGRVVVEAAMDGKTFVAQEIRFSSAGEKKGHEGMTHSATTP